MEPQGRRERERVLADQKGKHLGSSGRTKEVSNGERVVVVFFFCLHSLTWTYENQKTPIPFSTLNPPFSISPTFCAEGTPFVSCFVLSKEHSLILPHSSLLIISLAVTRDLQAKSIPLSSSSRQNFQTGSSYSSVSISESCKQKGRVSVGQVVGHGAVHRCVGRLNL